jgi:hypothetical protein
VYFFSGQKKDNKGLKPSWVSALLWRFRSQHMCKHQRLTDSFEKLLSLRVFSCILALVNTCNKLINGHPSERNIAAIFHSDPQWRYPAALWVYERKVTTVVATSRWQSTRKKLRGSADFGKIVKAVVCISDWLWWNSCVTKYALTKFHCVMAEKSAPKTRSGRNTDIVSEKD